MPNMMTVSDVQRILQNLLAERVSIANLDLVIEILVDIGRSIKDPAGIDRTGPAQASGRSSAMACAATVTS